MRYNYTFGRVSPDKYRYMQSELLNLNAMFLLEAFDTLKFSHLQYKPVKSVGRVVECLRASSLRFYFTDDVWEYTQKRLQVNDPRVDPATDSPYVNPEPPDPRRVVAMPYIAGKMPEDYFSGIESWSFKQLEAEWRGIIRSALVDLKINPETTLAKFAASQKISRTSLSAALSGEADMPWYTAGSFIAPRDILYCRRFNPDQFMLTTVNQCILDYEPILLKYGIPFGVTISGAESRLKFHYTTYNER